MTYYKKISLNIENQGNYDFHCTYNRKTKFYDLLENIASNYPDLNVCPCFKFQCMMYSRQNDIDMNSGVYEYLNTYGYKQFQIINNNSDKKCNCNKYILNFFKKTKLEIIEYITKINESIEKILSDDSSFINNSNPLIGKIQSLISDLKCKNEDTNERLKIIEEENNKLQKEKKILEFAVNGDITTINELKNLGITGQLLSPNKNTISIDNKTGQITEKYNKNELKSNTNKDSNFIDFYDVIIDIKSIKDINKGWEIKMSKRAKENYEDFKKDEIIKIGVIGNSNKGKSFLLSKISKIKLPSGTSIRTEGLSIKYPELDGVFKNRKIALLDSAGLETPVLKSDNEEETENGNTKMAEKELFREKSREKLITELFLQNYIIQNSDIIIIVVGILTYSEQKLLIRIKNEIKKAKINKPLYIIHNLITYVSVSQVEEYINNLLLNSATFNLVKGHNINTKTKTETGIYYYEKNVEPNIYHLIFANEGSKAGNYYNNLTLTFLENSYQNVTNLKPFDVIETVKERFMEISKEIFEKTQQPLSKKDFENTDNKLLIKLNNPSKLVLKKCLIDELGFSNLKSNGFEPTYNYYKKDDKIIVRVEGPGNCSINSSIDYAGEYTIIKINGNKKKDKEPQKLEDNIFNSRELGDFSLDIPLKSYDYLIKNEDPIIGEKKGILILEYQIDKKKENKEYVINEEDEV